MNRNPRRRWAHNYSDHHSYHPYAVRSTSPPSAMTSGTLNVPDNGDGLVEGWWAVFTVVQWHKLSQRQRMSLFVPGSESTRQGVRRYGHDGGWCEKRRGKLGILNIHGGLHLMCVLLQGKEPLRFIRVSLDKRRISGNLIGRAPCLGSTVDVVFIYYRESCICRG
ncbi:hypothetical protein EDD17DRAFT_174057 [Pisolithus thermaeus]|nr:hypothetical protein EV401DRAFT_1498365 [Pisolithus croceorrhizus]KAI6165621.1 hypothetical protein EDD17DRAFT_174057 [Pisolithus thermaeus]